MVRFPFLPGRPLSHSSRFGLLPLLPFLLHPYTVAFLNMCVQLLGGVEAAVALQAVEVLVHLQVLPQLRPGQDALTHRAVHPVVGQCRRVPPLLMQSQTLDVRTELVAVLAALPLPVLVGEPVAT